MQLREWIRDQNLTPEQFGDRVGASKFAVGKWCRGERVPRPDAMQKIYEATGGAVTAQDFYEAA